MTNIHLAQLILNTPLFIEAHKLDVILQVLGPKFQGQALFAQTVELPEREAIDPALVSEPSLSIVPIVGTLVNRAFGLDAMSGLTTYHEIRDQLEADLANPAIQGIVLDVDSPGGEVSGLLDLAEFIRSAAQQKPMIAVVDAEAYSAAYTLASATGNVIVPQTGGVGSVGVLAVHVDQSQHDAKEGFAYTFVASGKRKAEYNEHEPLSDGARQRLQTHVDQVYELVATMVARHMPVSRQTLDQLQGGVVFGQDAVTLGLATQVRSKSDAIEDFISQALGSGALQSNGRDVMKPKTVTIVKGSAVGPTETGKTAVMPQEDQEGDQSELHTAAHEKEPDLRLTKGQLLEVLDLGPDEDTMASTYVMDVISACRLAGKPELAEKFLAKKMPLKVIQKALVDSQAHEDEALEIVSTSAPIQTDGAVKPQVKINTDEIYANRQKQMIGV